MAVFLSVETRHGSRDRQRMPASVDMPPGRNTPQLAGARPPTLLDQQVRRGPIEPADDQHAEIAFPGKQAWHASARVAGEPGGGERFVQLGLRLRILGVDLDREATA